MQQRSWQLVVVALFCAQGTASFAGNEKALTAASLRGDQGVVVLQVNWGRKWPCGGFENAQLEGLTFTRTDNSPNKTFLALETTSKLLVQDSFLPYAFVVEPGEYALSAYDVKIARSRTDVGHLKLGESDLIKDNKPVAGAFSVRAGEIVYIGHFGLDCAKEPIPWRYFVDGRAEFERYVEGFRKRFPFTKSVPVQYRLFSTSVIGEEHSLENPTVN